MRLFMLAHFDCGTSRQTSTSENGVEMVGFERKQATLNRDCEVVQIPSGEKMTLHKDTPVTITQTLGGNYTVITDHGFMVRISGRDADCIGEIKTVVPQIDPT